MLLVEILLPPSVSGINGGVTYLRSSCSQSMPAKNACYLISSAPFLPQPILELGYIKGKELQNLMIISYLFLNELLAQIA